MLANVISGAAGTAGAGADRSKAGLTSSASALVQQPHTHTSSILVGRAHPVPALATTGTQTPGTRRTGVSTSPGSQGRTASFPRGAGAA